MEGLPQILYTVKEACQILNLSRTSIWKAIKSGRLKPSVLSIRRVLFTRKALEDFANQQDTQIQKRG